MRIDERRVEEWFADLAGCEQAAVRAEVATWSAWLINSMDESGIATADLVEFLRTEAGE